MGLGNSSQLKGGRACDLPHAPQLVGISKAVWLEREKVMQTSAGWHDDGFSPSPGRSFPTPIGSILLATALGLLVRLLFLGSKSLWLDEAWSLMVAQGKLTDLWSGVADKMNPPGYYLLLMPWVRLGESEFWLRLPSVLLGTAAIPMTYRLARLLYSEAVGLSAAWLLALSPILVWYSQEARAYALLIVLALGSMISLVNALRQQGAKWWAAHALLTASMFYTHYSALWILPVQAGLVLSEPFAVGGY